MRQKTRELALCSMLGALGVVLLFLGGILPFAFYSCPLLASAILLIVREECRRQYAWSCFFAVAVLGLLLGPDKEAVLLYCCLGYYPLLQPKLDTVRPAFLRVGVKLGIFAAAIGSMYALLLFLFQMEAVAQELSTAAPWLLAATVGAGLLLFFLYDELLRRFTWMYRRRKKK